MYWFFSKKNIQIWRTRRNAKNKKYFREDWLPFQKPSLQPCWRCFQRGQGPAQGSRKGCRRKCQARERDSHPKRWTNSHPELNSSDNENTFIFYLKAVFDHVFYDFLVQWCVKDVDFEQIPRCNFFCHVVGFSSSRLRSRRNGNLNKQVHEYAISPSPWTSCLAIGQMTQSQAGSHKLRITSNSDLREHCHKMHFLG